MAVRSRQPDGVVSPLQDSREPHKDLPALVRAEHGALALLLCFIIYPIAALALLVFGGRHQVDRHGNAQDLLILFLGWTLGSAWAGATLGMAAPWMRRLPIALAVAPVAVLPPIVGFIAADANGIDHWSRHQTVLSVVISLVFGVFVGVGIWKRVRTVASGLVTPNDPE